jgi:CRISPR-associated protein Cmr1
MDRVSSLEAELEAVTPLWMGGAARQAELRPPAVRGCLRFWFRALAGGVLGEDLGRVWAAESAVFGNLNRASSVVVRLSGSPRASVSVTGHAEQPPGLAYMFWSVFQQKRDAILPGERFRLRLHTRPFPFAPVEVMGRTLGMTESFEMAAASLWLLVRLGGLGARARRGAGGVRAVGDPAGWPDSLPSLASAATTPAELARELSNGIEQVRQATGWSGIPPGDGASFDILHGRVCQLHVADITFPSWWEALNWAGEQFRNYRIAYKLDATGVAALLTQGRMAAETIQRAILGLPITFFFKSIFAELTGRGIDPREARRKASATVSPLTSLGRASPLFFRIVPLSGRTASYTVLLGLFRSRFLPDHQMTVKPADYSIRPVRVGLPRDYSLIDKWFDYLKEQNINLLSIPLH